MTSKQLSNNSERYFIGKFTKEIIGVWQEFELDENNKNNETLDFSVLKDFLIKLGFISASQYSNECYIGEKDMGQEIWKVLGGEIKGHVTLNNLRILLLAILGTFIEPALNKDEQVLEKLETDSFGSFNEHGDLFLEIHEISKI
eukprot:CAMPEP_0170552220 /NCGR_PEP_ID=MMETSP0211-20121228/10138_1 /TAXON_ID=311385 /ORGANISM="Pseudokeronopsis sp., Strain OXSARD2" /LENGTH=143 /DNA_ID=CAMNT_0010859809 /DNA_START=1413 /DNA_END=1844 /DNA_ORIENTATION=+